MTRMPSAWAWFILDKVSGGAEPRAYAIEVADVVAVVAVGRAVERLQPDAGDTETVQVIEAPAQSLEVPDAVAVEVHVGGDVQAINNGVLEPVVVYGHRDNLSKLCYGCLVIEDVDADYKRRLLVTMELFTKRLVGGTVSALSLRKKCGAVWYPVKKYLKKSRIKTRGMGPHALRHTFATLLLNQDENLGSFRVL